MATTSALHCMFSFEVRDGGMSCPRHHRRRLLVASAFRWREGSPPRFLCLSFISNPVGSASEQSKLQLRWFDKTISFRCEPGVWLIEKPSLNEISRAKKDKGKLELDRRREEGGGECKMFVDFMMYFHANTYSLLVFLFSSPTLSPCHLVTLTVFLKL